MHNKILASSTKAISPLSYEQEVIISQINWLLKVLQQPMRHVTGGRLDLQ